MVEEKFHAGQKVVSDGEVYDFGYYTNWGCVLYLPGEKNMQDSLAIETWRVKAVEGEIAMTTPTEPGWYWLLDGDWEIVQVYPGRKGALFVGYCGMNIADPVDMFPEDSWGERIPDHE